MSAYRSAALYTTLLVASCSTTRRSDAGVANAQVESASQETSATEIAWESYEAGLARARAEHKPAILVFTATWCSQCQAYRQVLSNPNVIALSQRFVMIQVDIDQEPALNQRHSPDGTYVPRTMFVGADGQMRPELRPPSRERYAYFLSPRDPSELLSLMQRALRPS